MATQLFLRTESELASQVRPNEGLGGAEGGVRAAGKAATSRGTTNANAATSTIAGPTSGVYARLGAGDLLEWFSDPIDADFTLSGTITFNIWMHESAMNANCGAQVQVFRVGPMGGIISTVVNSERGVEVGTSSAAQNWTASPTSTDFKKGDRVLIRVLANDVGTMGTGFTWTLSYNGPTGGAQGDTYVTFTETFGSTTPASTIVQRTSTNGSNTGTTCTVTKPTGTVEGDLMHAWIGYDATDGSINSTPSGWSLLTSAVIASVQGIAVYEKICGASEPASWDWGFSASTNFNHCGVAYQGSTVDKSGTVYEEDTDSTGNTTAYVDISATPNMGPVRGDALVVYGLSISSGTPNFADPNTSLSTSLAQQSVGDSALIVRQEVFESGEVPIGDNVCNVDMGGSFPHCGIVLIVETPGPVSRVPYRSDYRQLLAH